MNWMRLAAPVASARFRVRTRRNRRSTSCLPRWMALSGQQRSSSSPPRTGPGSSIQYCCVRGGSSARRLVDRPDKQGGMDILRIHWM